MELWHPGKTLKLSGVPERISTTFEFKKEDRECWWSKEKKPKHMGAWLFIIFTVAMIGCLHNAVLPNKIRLPGMFLSLDPWSVHHPPLDRTHELEVKIQRYILTSSPSLSQVIVREQENSFEHSQLRVAGKETTPSDTNCGHVAKKQDNCYLNKVLLKSQSLSLQSCSTLKQSAFKQPKSVRGKRTIPGDL